MALKTIPWSIQDHIATPEQQAGFLEAALELAIEERDAGFFAKALGEVAKARGMSEVARTAGVTREGLYKALSKDGDPQLSTLIGVIGALGFKISVSEREVA